MDEFSMVQRWLRGFVPAAARELNRPFAGYEFRKEGT